MAAARKRKRHEQMALFNKKGTGKARQMRKARRARPGDPPKRRRGRPANGARAGESHQRRDAFKASEPIHVVLRVEKAIGKLRRRDIYRAVREATFVVATREDFRIVHLSIQGTHLHLLVEASGKAALSRGMQAFQISAAKRMNAIVLVVDEGTGEARARRGRVFSDRYHAEVITSRKQARHALAYVLNNWRKHREDTAGTARIDRYSTGILFRGWAAFADPSFAFVMPSDYEPLIVRDARTWLLREGWKMYGRLDFDEVPSSPARGPRSTGDQSSTRNPSRSRT